MQHEECRGEDQGRGGSCSMCPLGRPLRAVSGHAAWPWLRRPGRRGARYSAYSEAPAAMSPRQRHCSLPDPVRSGSPPARSLHLLPLTVLQPVQNDAVWGPLPPVSSPPPEQRAGRRTESAQGEEGRIRRKHPEARPSRGAQGHCLLHHGERWTEAEEEDAAGRELGGSLRPAPPAWLGSQQGGSPPGAFC